MFMNRKVANQRQMIRKLYIRMSNRFTSIRELCRIKSSSLRDCCSDRRADPGIRVGETGGLHEQIELVSPSRC